MRHPGDRSISQTWPDQYCVAMSEPVEAPAAGEDPAPAAPRVSTRRGWWSVGLPLLSSAVVFIGGLGLFLVLGSIFGSPFDTAFQVASRVALILLVLLVIGMLITAIMLGIGSIGSAWPQRGRPGRATAVVLGCIGIALSLVMIWWAVLPALQSFTTPAVWS